MLETYGQFRFGIIVRIMRDGLTPNDVAMILEQNRQLYPEIQRSEIESYREMGEFWDYYPGSRDRLTYGSLKQPRHDIPMSDVEPILEKRYENLRPNLTKDVSERWFESAEGKAAMLRWYGRG